MIRPPKPRPRRSIHSDKMATVTGNNRHSHSSQHASENVLPSQNTDNPGADSSSLTDEQEYTYENNAADSTSQCDKVTKSPARRFKFPETVTIVRIGSILVCTVAVVVAVGGYWWPSSNDKSHTEHESSLKDAIGRIREEFPSQLDDIWPAFSAGIKETAQGTPTKRPSVFMLLYETEEGTPFCLAQKIGNISTHFLNATKLHPLIIEGADLEHNETLVEDFGIMLEEYRLKVEEQRTMIINNVHKIPGKVAQSFHFFCDSVSPVVEMAVYFFTMKAPGITSSSNTPTEIAEKVLSKLWSDKLEEDILNPLITRITDMTLMIKPEMNLAQCEI